MACPDAYRRQFEKTVQQDGEDPSKFAVALETLAVKAFGDIGPKARNRIIRDQFIAGHPNSVLRRYLDSVPPETPIRDIVDRCRLWESHADTDDQRVVKPMLERAQPVYAVSEPTLGPTEQVITAVSRTSVGLADLETMLKRLLPAVPAQAPPPRSAPTEIEAMEIEAPASRNTHTGAETPSGDSPQGLRYCASPMAITVTGQVDARRWT